MSKYQINIDRDGNDYCIEVLDSWKGRGRRRTIEIIPPKTWFWKRNKHIKEKIAEEVRAIKCEISDEYII